MVQKVACIPSGIPAPFCHAHPPFVIPAKAGIYLHMAKRAPGSPTEGWIPVCTGMTERDPQHGTESCRHSFWHSRTLLSCPPSFCHSRESGNLSSHGKKGAWLTNRRMDSRLHGNDGKRPPTWYRKLSAFLLAFPHPSVIPAPLLSFPRKRESIFTWQEGRLAHQQKDGFPFARE